MKWLFATLLALNIIVFAGMVGNKILNPAKNGSQLTQVGQQHPQNQQPVVINIGQNGQPTTGGAASAPNGAVKPNMATSSTTGNVPNKVVAPNKMVPNKQLPTTVKAEGDSGKSNVQYRACSARVSMPEDDYHRIKGLLGRFPHAATRQVVEGGGEGESQTSSRMNVLFMSVTDQDASTIQGIVGRYGSLNRAPCNK